MTVNSFRSGENAILSQFPSFESQIPIITQYNIPVIFIEETCFLVDWQWRNHHHPGRAWFAPHVNNDSQPVTDLPLTT